MNTEELVLKAVKGLNNGESEQYDVLVKELKKKTLDTPSLYLNALRRAVKHINRRHETLIGIMLNVDWTCYEGDTANIFIEFLADLISVKTFYVKVCIRSLIKQFVPKAEVFDDHLHITLKKKCDHIHTALQTILHIAPLSSKFVVEAVRSCFPYLGKSLFVLETYIVHILQLAVYAHDVRFEMLQLLIDKLISIDVLTHRHKSKRENIREISQYEMEQENKDKLDQLMTIFFAYIDSVSFIDGALDYENGVVLFKDLLGIHETFIIKAQCSHVQFLLFYMASLHKDFTEAFIATCWRILQDPNYAGILRQASACYLSSFLARSKFVGTDVIKRELKNLSEWIHRYIDFQEDNTYQPTNKTKHAPFYSACQALFYVFVYHHKLLLKTSNDIKFIKSMNLVRIVTSRLNPLKNCLDSVVNMFARFTRMYQIVFCYSIIERNNRSLEQMNERSGSEPDTYLGNFFPFDPYMLPKSGKWIEPLYCQWSVTMDIEGNT